MSFCDHCLWASQKYCRTSRRFKLTPVLEFSHRINAPTRLFRCFLAYNTVEVSSSVLLLRCMFLIKYDEYEYINVLLTA